MTQSNFLETLITYSREWYLVGLNKVDSIRLFRIIRKNYEPFWDKDKWRLFEGFRKSRIYRNFCPNDSLVEKDIWEGDSLIKPNFE